MEDFLETSKFDCIRPYSDSEAVAAFQRIAEDEHVQDIFDYIYPNGGDVEKFRLMLRALGGVADFQRKIMYPIVKAIIEKTTAGISYSGINNLQDGHMHLLLSNHRDIILDPAIIQVICFDNDVPRTEIAVGDNLITSKFIEDVTRSNGMVRVVRGGTPREKYTYSALLSEYLRERIAGEKYSLWIAQRNGRAKNGIDTTEQGLLKMLEMSGSGDFVRDFAELSIIPVSISYQFEPCDFLKAREIYISRREAYVKKSGEDFISILTGIKQYKGSVHFNFSSPMDLNDIESCSRYDKNERFKALATIADDKITSSYRLWDNNYIAHDILNNTDTFASQYAEEAKNYFIDYMENGLSQIVEKDRFIDIAELREVFLSIYANPIRV